MKTKMLFRPLLTIFALLAPTALLAQSGRTMQKAEGTWIFHAVLPPQVGTGNDGKTPSYAGTSRLNADGTISGSTLDQHTGPQFGEWAQIGYHEIAFTFVSDTYDAAGNYLNTNRVRGIMNISDDGQTGSGTTLLEIIDKTGKIVFTAPATTDFTGTRITLLSLPK